MFILYQTLGAIITLGYIVGAPLLIGLIVALARGAARRSVIVLASVATALVFVGVVSADAITGLRSQIAYYQNSVSAQGAFNVSLAYLILATGLSINFAAVVLGLRETAQTRRWGWFIAFLLTQVAAGIGTMLLYVRFAQFGVLSQLTNRLYYGDPTVSIPYYLISSLLLICVPLGALLFATLGLPLSDASPTSSTIPTPPQGLPYQPYPYQHPSVG